MTKLLRQATTYTTHPTIIINSTIIIIPTITKFKATTEYPTIRTTSTIVIKT
jgi:hypothetical protein